MRWLVPVVMLVGCSGGLSPSPFDDAEFERRVWIDQHGSTDPDNPRGPMADAVASDVLEAGMHRDDVEALLGTPDFDTAAPDHTVWRYTLGAWSGWRVDYDSLDVHFDGDHVARVERTQH